MKTLLRLLALYLIVTIAVIVSVPLDYCEDQIYHFKHKASKIDDSILVMLYVITIIAIVLTIFGIFYHFDVINTFNDYYFELCRKLTWSCQT